MTERFNDDFGFDLISIYLALCCLLHLIHRKISKFRGCKLFVVILRL